MVKRKAFNAAPALHAFVGNLVQSGNHANHGEVVRGGLRLLKHEDEQWRRGAGRRPLGRAGGLGMT